MFVDDNSLSDDTTHLLRYDPSGCASYRRLQKNVSQTSVERVMLLAWG